jgi:Asp-tRNA(Asn)/Glu-tRNA(Gln) amidotransferase C subunit
VADLLAFDQLQRRVTLALEGGVSQAEVKQLFSAPETFAKFRADIEKGVGPVRLMIEFARTANLQLWKETEGMTASEAMAHIEQRSQEATRAINKYEELGDSIKKAQGVLEQQRVAALAAADRWVSVGWIADVRSLGGIWERFTGHVENSPLVKQARTELVRAMAPFTEANTPVSAESLKKLEEAYELYKSILKPSAKSTEAIYQFIAAASAVVNQAQDVERQVKGMEAMREPVEKAMWLRPDAENALKAAEEAAKKAKESVGEAKEEAKGANDALGKVSQIDMSNLVRQTQAIADAMWSAATASWNIQAPAGEMTAAHGGKAWNFLAAGGRPQGTDVIPAMLSPGEVVINAASARRFAAQLTAINAGVQPVYRSEGGSVTNIGDINVTVSGGGSSRQTARSIAAELRRELRRGTATL